MTEAQVIYRSELTIEPHVKVDDRNAIQFVELIKLWHFLPLFRRHTLDNVYWYGRHVFIGNNLTSWSKQEMHIGRLTVNLLMGTMVATYSNGVGIREIIS